MAQLDILHNVDQHEFFVPVKKINDGDDVGFFLTSTAYADIMTFLLQLNAAMFPVTPNGKVKSWQLGDNDQVYSPSVRKLQNLVSRLDAAVGEAPPDPGPRRFGNVSFRKWYQIISSRASHLLDEFLPDELLSIVRKSPAARDELQAYLLGSFGSAQRLDYGTGHELSFLAFLGCIWKLGGFVKSEPGIEERGIVLGIIEQYLRLIRRLILTYTLEPAGSHGVWGLDDHSFAPYIFGSAQLSPPISSLKDIPTEGSLEGAPNPTDVVKLPAVERERKTNMYFSAIGFIYDVKKGPFWEHSPILFDISGVRAGWAKINKGMIKMYNAEVLSKFPVVQHFPFGSLYRWERNPDAAAVLPSIHASSQPQRQTPTPATAPIPPRTVPQEGTKAPWAVKQGSSTQMSSTSAPWASNLSSSAAVGRTPNIPVTAAPWSSTARPMAPGTVESTRVPWPTSDSSTTEDQVTMPPTRAPWADKNTR